MKVLMPFWDLNLMHRYLPQIEAIAKLCSEFHVIYWRGYIQHEWRKHIRFHKVTLPQYPSYLRYYFGRSRIWWQIRDIDIDIYYCLSGLWFQYYASYFSEKSGKPFVIRLRGDDRTTRIKQKVHRLKIMWFEDINRLSFNKANMIIPISKKLISTALGYGLDENIITDIVHNGINTELFEYHKKEDNKFHIGYAGRLSPEKGSDYLMNLMKNTPDLNYVIAGENPYKLKFPENCEYLGILNYKDMDKEFYHKCDVIIMPSYFEGFPNTILEAYLCGKIIIVSSQAIPEEIKLFGLQLKHNLNLWINNLRMLKNSKEINKEDLFKTGLNARKYVYKEFSWIQFGKAIYNEFMKIKKGGNKAT